MKPKYPSRATIHTVEHHEVAPVIGVAPKVQALVVEEDDGFMVSDSEDEGL